MIAAVLKECCTSLADPSVLLQLRGSACELRGAHFRRMDDPRLRELTGGLALWSGHTRRWRILPQSWLVALRLGQGRLSCKQLL